jgi:hypothetical protein
MPRAKDPRNQRVVVKMNTADLALLDSLRGTTPRGPYLRSLMPGPSAADAAPPSAVSLPVRGDGGGRTRGHQHEWVGRIGARYCRTCGANP